MKKLLLTLLVCNSINTLFAQTKKEEFDRELTSFINTIAPQFGSDSSYAVFVASFYADAASTNSFTLGYIASAADYQKVSPGYTYFFNNRKILIRVDAGAYSNLAEEIGFAPITTAVETNILSCFHPQFVLGDLTITGKSLTYRNINGTIERVPYDDPGAVPSNKSIYKNQ